MKKSVLEFQHEYLEFELQYGLFLEETRRKSAGTVARNTEKAGPSAGKVPPGCCKDTINGRRKQIVLKSFRGVVPLLGGVFQAAFSRFWERCP